MIKIIFKREALNFPVNKKQYNSPVKGINFKKKFKYAEPLRELFKLLNKISATDCQIIIIATETYRMKRDLSEYETNIQDFSI